MAAPWDSYAEPEGPAAGVDTPEPEAGNYRPLIETVSRKHGVNANLAHALVDTESGGDPYAVSEVGAAGLTQLMPATAREMGVENRFDPEQSLHGGIGYLRGKLDKYQTPEEAIAAYHGGDNPENWGPKTQAYVRKVSQRWNMLEAMEQARQAQAPPPAPAPSSKPWERFQPPASGKPWERFQSQATPAAAEPASTEGQSTPGAMWNAVRRGVVEGTGSAIAGAGDIYRNVTGGDPTQDNAAITAGHRLEQRAQESYPVAPSQEGLATKVAGGFGGMVPMMIAGGAGTVAGAAGVAAGPAAGVLGGLVYAGTGAYDATYREATANGASPVAADNQAAVNALAQSAIMTLPVARVLHAVPQLQSGLWNTLVGAAKRGVEFAGFNSLGRFVDNYIASRTSDPHRDLMDGVSEAAEVGALTGPIFHIPQAAQTLAGGRRPVVNPALANNIAAQQQAAAGAQAPVGTPASPSPATPQPAAPAPAPPPVAPPPVARPTAPIPPGGSADPHKALSIIAQGGNPQEVAAQEAAAAAAPPPAPPEPPAPPATAPPVAENEGPRKARSPSQIQREDGVGYNTAVKIHNIELDEYSQAMAGRPVATPPPHPDQSPETIAAVSAIADQWDALGNPKMAAAVRSGLAGPRDRADTIPFLQSKLDEAIAAAGGNAPKPTDTFDLDQFMDSAGKRAPAQWAAFKAGASPQATALVEAVRGATQNITDKINALGFPLHSSLTTPGVTALRQNITSITGTFSRWKNGEWKAQRGNPPADLDDSHRRVLEALAEAGYPHEAPAPVESTPPAVESKPPRADEPTPGWLAQNNAAAVELANRLGLTEKVGEMARAGMVAKDISAALNGALDVNQVRAVRDHLGIAAAGPAGGLLTTIPEAKPAVESKPAEPAQDELVRQVQAIADEWDKLKMSQTAATLRDVAASQAITPEKVAAMRARLAEAQAQDKPAAPAQPPRKSYTQHGSEAERAANKLSVDALNGDITTADAVAGLGKMVREGTIPEGVARVNLSRLDDWTEDQWKAATAPPEPETGTKPEPKPNESKEQQPPTDARPADWGSKNTFFTKDLAEAARERLRAKLNGSTLNAGFDPQLMGDGLILAGYHIEAGARSFVDYSKAMLSDLGENVRPFLAHFYGAVRGYPGFDATGMDDHATVEAHTKEQADAQPRDGGLGEPGSGEAGTGRPGTGEPPRDETDRPLENPPATDGAGLGEPGAGDAGEAGVRTGSEVLPDHDGKPADGHADDGRGGGGDEGLAADGAGKGKADEPTPAPSRPNFHIDDPERLVGGTPKVRFARNRAALEALSAIQGEQRPPTPAELEAMAGYIGWGSFGQDLFQGSFERPRDRPGWNEEAQWLRDHLGKENWESAQRSIINAHYTDPITVQAMWDMVQHMGFKGGRVLEPSMGVGNFFGLMPRDVMARSTLTGIELDRVTGAMAQLLYPDAGVHIKGYEDSHTPDNFYDLVIGNWPFAAAGPPDRRYAALTPTLHDYFFLKALDQTRPGGLVVGITSAGTMDKAGRATRLELARQAELIGAFRLPSGAFGKYAGTSVVTDIMVLRKRERPADNPSLERWVASADMKAPSGGTIRVNQRYHDQPGDVLGQLDWGRGTTSPKPGMIVHRPEEAAYAKLLEGLAARLPADAYSPVLRGNEPRFVANNTQHRQGSILVHEGKLYQVAGETMRLLEDIHKPLTAGSAKDVKARVAQVKSLVGVREAYGALLDAERDGRPETEALRAKLHEAYAAFRTAHGEISKSPGLQVFNRAEDPAFPLLAALERQDGTPARILFEPTIRSKRTLENPSIADAYVLARNEQTNFDMDRVAALAQVSRAEAEQHLLENGAVLRTPGGGYEPADTYLSGNVRKKLREAEQALALGEPMQGSVDKLTEAVPATVPYYAIEAKLGAPWVGDEAYRHFIGELLGQRPEDTDGRIKVTFAGSRWKIEISDRRLLESRAANTLWGHPRVWFNRLLEKAFGNQVERIMDPADKDGGPYYNAEASEKANEQITRIREKFTEWAWADPSRKIQFERAYNETMNAIAKPRYDGSFMDMSGMALRRGDDPFSLRRHQVNAIWRGVSQGRGLFAHEVGTGKTYTMGGIAVEGRRYGVFRKPLLFAHNANSAAVAREMGEMYPGAKILYIDNLTPKNIKTQMHRIANDDWDAVVMPHSQIDRMALTEATLKELAANQIAELESEAIDAAEADGQHLTPEIMDDPKELRKVRSPTAKDLVKQRQAIIANIKKAAERSSRPDAVAFEHLGVDAIMVDEAHEFKKPPIATRMKLRGLNTATSNRSISLNFLTGYVNKLNNGKGVYLFTGTPVTNTLNEIYNQSRYFMGDRLAEAGVKDWDTWFNTFADALTEPELTAAGTFEPVKRLAAFVNTDELVRMMSEFTDVVQAKDMPEFTPRATADGKTLQSPDLSPEDREFLVNGRTDKPLGRPYKKIITDVGEMSPRQREILEDIQERVTEFKAADGKTRYEWMMAGDRRSPIITDQDGPKASLDARMHDPDAPDHPASKVNRVARNVARIYQEPGASQAVFVDIGYAAGVSQAGRADKFVLVQDLIGKLVEAGIPRKEIAVVAGGVTAEEKKAIADEMNAGTKRVVIGQSGTLGVGVNMQRNLRAMHHMDAPWRPGDLEQRNGRGERQGNEWNTVQEYRYITEGIDGRRWQVLTAKDRFIKQFIAAFNDTSGKRLGALEGDAADLSEEDDMSSTLSAAAGDPRLMQRAKLKTDVDRLQRRERLHTTGQADAREQVQSAQREQRRYMADHDAYMGWAATWTEASQRAAAAAAAAKDPRRWYEATVEGVPLNRGDEIQAAIDKQILQMAPGDERTLATINGFNIEAQWRAGKAGPDYWIADAAGARLADIILPTLPRIIPRMNDLAGAGQAAKWRADQAGKSVDALTQMLGQDFPQRDSLDKKRQQLILLEDDLSNNPTPAPSWLRHGAPLDSLIYVDRQPYEVRGHRMTDDYYLATDAGDVSYRRAMDENGEPMFEVRPPPEKAPLATAPDWMQPLMAALTDRTGVDQSAAQFVWGRGDLALVAGVEFGERAYLGFKKGAADEEQAFNVFGLPPKGVSPHDASVMRQAVKELEDREKNRAAVTSSVHERNPALAAEDDFDRGDDSQYARRKKEPALKSPPAETLEARDKLHAAASAMLQHLGISDKVALKLVDTLANAGANGADARYGKGLIEYALDSQANDAPFKIYHEAVHAMMDPALQILTPGQRNALLRGADRWLHDGREGVKRRADLQQRGYAADELRHEAVAFMAEQALAKGLQPRSLIATAIERMRNFGHALGQVLRGQGWSTAKDVLDGLMRGDRAAPGAQAALAKSTQAIRDGARKPEAPQEYAPADADEEPGQRSLDAVMADQRDREFALRRPGQGVAEHVRQEFTANSKRMLDDVEKALSPSTRGDQAATTAMIARGQWGKLRRVEAQTRHQLRSYERMFERLPEAEQLEFTHRVETGQRQPTPELQAAADAIRRPLDHWGQLVNTVSGRLENPIDDYMGRAYSNYGEWKAGLPGAVNPGTAINALAAASASKSPIQGAASFLKQRRFPTLREAMAAKLIPVTTNPARMQMMKLQEMQRYVAGTRIGQDMKSTGLARWFPHERYGEARGQGMVELDDRYFNPKSPIAKPGHGLNEHGKWMAPEAAARVFNNFVSKGLRGNSLYDGMRAIGNAVNAMQLGLSGFHATFVSLDTMISRVALGLQQISRGDVGRGLVNTALGFSPHSVVTAMRRGSELKRAYLDPSTASPEMQQIAKAYAHAGGTFGNHELFQSAAAGSFFKDIGDFKNPRSVLHDAAQMFRDTPVTAPLRLIGRILDTTMEPVMGQLVPRAKAGVFADLAADYFRRNPTAAAADVAHEMNRIQDSVDNRLGQLNYDNLFWHKTGKDVAFITVRSVGWNLGTIRELGGAGVDTVRAGRDVAQGRKPELTTRMAYGVAMTAVTAAVGAVLTYLYTGQGPQELKDYFYPPTGNGGRMSIPGYLKDVIAAWHAPLQTGLNKLHPLLSIGQQLYQNKDYHSGVIHAQGEGPGAYGNFLIGAVMPFTYSAMLKNRDNGATELQQMLSWFGIQPAPQSITNPEREAAYRLREDRRGLHARNKEANRVTLFPQ